MNKIIRIIMSYTICIMIILCLFACSVKEIFVDDNVKLETTSAYIMNNMYDAAPSNRMSSKVVNNAMSAEEAVSEQDIISEERKIIKNYNISGETKSFDITYDYMLAEIKKLDGIVDHQSIDNQRIIKEQKQRYLYMTIRIPTDKAEQFNKFLNNNINVLSKSESQQDITDNYNDTKLWIETLRQEQIRLNELFTKATTVEELVKIENRLQEITYEIQRLESRMKNFDNRVDYSTFNISVSEVVIFTEPEKNIPTQDDLIIRFNENFEKCKLFLIGIGIYIFTHLPAIALCLLFLLIVLIVIQVILKKPNNNIIVKTKKKYNNKKVVDNIDNNNKSSNESSISGKLSQDIQVQSNSIKKKITIPKTTHYGDVAVRVMSDAEIEHDKQLKSIEDEKYNEEKKDVVDSSIEGQLSQAHNIISQDITDIKTLMEQKVDE